jgi:hypothetical protein
VTVYLHREYFSTLKTILKNTLMKKITLVMLLVASFSALSFAQNLVTNPGFEADAATFTVAETTTNVLMAVNGIQDATTRTSNPTATATTVSAGMWVKKAPNTGYVKHLVTETDKHAGLRSLNLKINPNYSSTGLTSWYNCVALQKIATSLNNNKKYKASVWARLDDTTPNASVNIYLFLTDNTAKANITKTIALTGGTTWTKYETTFDLPTHITSNPTANFATAFFGAGMTTTYNGSVTNYSGLLIDDFTLEEDVTTAVNETSVTQKAFTLTTNGLFASKAGELTIYSLSGAKMSQQLINAGETMHLPKGMHIAQLKSTDGIYTQKVNL